ncbi:Hypothetical protein R9X50_00309100 [Acrodontium crateriforme]|uniref:Up-regulated during septation protein 1 domain-containing protein n=1 Tax=Acrodontium crateriforme TaxID=150365 RepID=A0AAQ3M204_9PEZI|nr:Hypothetical protein R9X50_00309100 [Acrodontium crateriforme]
MPRAPHAVQEAPSTTHWTLGKHDTPLQSPSASDRASMQATHYPSHMRDLPSPRYDSYEGSDYGAPLAHTTSLGWKGGHSMGQSITGRDLYEDYDYSPPTDERDTQRISVNTRVRPQNTDEVGQHLLYETALLDSQSYDIMQIGEVDALKKEHARLNSKIESAQRKLALESKVKDAAQNLQRLYSINSKNRPDTPQSPQSPSHGGTAKGRNSGESFDHTLNQAENELAASVRKVDALNEIIKGLLERRQMVERKLLKHTAAVLAEQTSRPTTISATPFPQKRQSQSDGDDYSPDEFDGIRDIVLGNKSRKTKGAALPGGQLENLQDRLDQLNSYLRRVIAAANSGREPEAEPALNDANDDQSTKLDKRMDRLEANLKKLEVEQIEAKAHYDRVEQSTFMTRNAVEEQLASLSHLAHNTLLMGSDMQEMQTLREPPQATGNGYQHQLQYLEESIMSMEQLLQQHSQELHSARETGKDVESRIASQANKNDEYETTIAGLWDILQSENSPHGERTSALKEDFSLSAFSSRVQHIFDRAQAAKDQQDILRRQIQQQRDLNGKSDTEKDRQIAELEKSHEKLSQTHNMAQEKLARALADHAALQSEADQSQSNLSNLMSELDQLKKTVDTKHEERLELDRQLQTHKSNAGEMQAKIQELEAELDNQSEAVSKHSALTEQLATAQAAREEAEKKHMTVRKDMEGLESEVVRLATELTMARAELDGAYGTRAERAKDAQAAGVDSVKERNQVLEKELEEMTTEFQELTKESIEMEKEREQLDGLLDDLRARCEELELQLSEAKVNGLGGAKSAADGDAPPIRESTSMTVMRHEFKKMMRETRAEGIKLLRAEQEERRKLEAELRRLRPSSTSLAVRNGGTTSATPSVAG